MQILIYIHAHSPYEYAHTFYLHEHLGKIKLAYLKINEVVTTDTSCYQLEHDAYDSRKKSLNPENTNNPRQAEDLNPNKQIPP
jgi:hypothetical protein